MLATKDFLIGLECRGRIGQIAIVKDLSHNISGSSIHEACSAALNAAR
jgi:hypothetical protein